MNSDTTVSVRSRLVVVPTEEVTIASAPYLIQKRRLTQSLKDYFIYDEVHYTAAPSHYSIKAVII